MKILTIIILFSLYVSQACGVSLIGSGIFCTTPNDGDTLNEGFLGTGYEGSWTETIGSGATLDEDHTLTGTPPEGSCTEGLNVETSGSADTYSKPALASALSYPIVINFELYVTTLTLASWNFINVFEAGVNGGSSDIHDVELWKDGTGNYYIVTSGLSASADIAFSLSTWHTVKLYLHSAASSSYLQLDGGTKYTFTRNSTVPDQFKLGALQTSSGEVTDIEFGRFWVDTP